MHYEELGNVHYELFPVQRVAWSGCSSRYLADSGFGMASIAGVLNVG